MKNDFYVLSADQWELIKSLLPTRFSKTRYDDKLTISGIIYVALNGCRWPDCPTFYGCPSTIYGRYRSWRYRKFWADLIDVLAENGWDKECKALISLSERPSRYAVGRHKSREIRKAIS